MGVHLETYEVRADGVYLTCEPAEVLPMAQHYFLFLDIVNFPLHYRVEGFLSAFIFVE